MTDGQVSIRPSGPADVPFLVAGRDEAFHRFLGPGEENPRPTGCIVIMGSVVGWVDYDLDRTWLEPGEVNLGYNVFAAERGKGYATRAVQLLMHHLAVRTRHRTATLLIDPGNQASLALADRAGFPRVADLDGNPYFKRPVPPVAYSDGVVTLRPPVPADLDADIEAKDEEQMRWMWRPGEREAWRKMTGDEQRDHAARTLHQRARSFGAGPKWTFSVDTATDRCVAYADCDLANDVVPHGEANISYACHPAHRGKGYVTRAIRLLVQFLNDHTGCRYAYIRVDAENHPSLRVAAALGASEIDRSVDGTGRTMVCHEIAIRPPAGAANRPSSPR